MNEAGREAVQGRDGPVQADGSANERRAVLVSERRAVITRPAAVELEAADPLAALADPIWDHKGGTAWTPELVHCRLLEAADAISRLPGASIQRYRSLLGDVADDEPDADFVPVTPPTPAQISVADWTWREILKRPADTRVLLMGMAFELGVRRIGRKLRISKSKVSLDYIAERRYLAGHWQTRKTEVLGQVDAGTFNRWRRLFENARK